MSCVCVGGGGGCSVANTTVQQYLTGFGIAYNPNDKIPYQVALAAHTPAGIGSFLNFYKNLGEACLRARALLFCNSTPGDCGAIANPTRSASNQLSIAGAISSGGISAGSSIAGALGLVSGPVLGLATAGAGLALTAILDIYQSHAAAEQRQSNVLCQVCPQFTTLVRQVDNAIFSGQASAEQGISTIQQAAATFKETVSQYAKACNAFCAYSAIAASMADVSQYYYGLTPIPGSASVLQVGSETYDEFPQTSAGIPGSAPIPITPATSGNTYVPVTSAIPATASALLGTNISPLAIAAAAILAIFLFKKGG